MSRHYDPLAVDLKIASTHPAGSAPPRRAATPQVGQAVLPRTISSPTGTVKPFLAANASAAGAAMPNHCRRIHFPPSVPDLETIGEPEGCDSDGWVEKEGCPPLHAVRHETAVQFRKEVVWEPVGTVGALGKLQSRPSGS